MNKRITAILREAHFENVKDQHSEKIFLIEDIIKVKKTLYGLGQMRHNEFITDSTATKLFDSLYELDITALELVLNNYSKSVTQIVKQRINN